MRSRGRSVLEDLVRPALPLDPQDLSALEVRLHLEALQPPEVPADPVGHRAPLDLSVLVRLAVPAAPEVPLDPEDLSALEVLLDRPCQW
jgi:hypothetical protein